ncbi:dTDP-4-dehydrorhamnose 3,5-epimerase family protein [Actinoallomurus sp. NPDC050550]|uniref:dTDP-4-dehydrorhamnose 3,5-epimerase family protein n=1 Tax=Actinoallomurus sp. NPDC050550 TaxID=3154937 RepID=UPI0033EB5F5A
MRVRRLGIERAVEFAPDVFTDHRGTSVQALRAGTFAEATGHDFFAVRQTLFSTSRRGVVRGIHFTATPPGSRKYVYCARGASLDILVDIRTGSPTFGRWEAVRLDARERRAVYFPPGVGHAFAILEEDTVMAYLLSNDYVPELELAVSPLDPELGLPIPDDITPILSERDREAPALAEALAAGILPDYAACLALDAPDAAFPVAETRP